MNCKHSIIQTYRFADNGEPAMWACAECKHKFAPFSQMLQELADEREACAKVCEELAALNRSSPTDSMWQWGECAAAIRARK